MKNTGVIRKIDDLGRIVIPKEIRKTLKINSSDDLEFYVDNNKIILQKYSFLSNNKNLGNNLIKGINKITNAKVIICDKEKVISDNELENYEIDKRLKGILNDRKEYINMDTFSFGNNVLKGYYMICPIIQNSDANGLVIIYKKEKLSNEEIYLCKIIKNIIENN